YAPLHVSAGYRTLDWNGESQFAAELWLHNAGPERTLLNVAVTISALDGRVLLQESLAAEAPAGRSEAAGDVSWRFPATFAEVFALHLEVIDEEGDCLARNDYLFSRAAEPIFAPLLAAPPAQVTAERGERLTLRNPGRPPAVLLS